MEFFPEDGQQAEQPPEEETEESAEAEEDAAAGAPTEPDPELGLDLDHLIWWVHTTLLPLVQRSAARVTWCPLWWEHSEAIGRLEMLRRAWEQAVASDDGDALSTWMIHHVDPHLDELLKSTGPFERCGYHPRHGFRNGEHSPQAPLPVFEPHEVPELD